jgi:hypothetical protein
MAEKGIGAIVISSGGKPAHAITWGMGRRRSS